MQFETIDHRDLAAPLLDVVQEAVDATATRYAGTPEIDVAQTLREQLDGRGVRATSDVTLDEVATAIRSGHEVRLGSHDGSVE